ncbi:MAG: hypothetical protein ACU0CA_08500 [Paracoccaceae bacterium]
MAVMSGFLVFFGFLALPIIAICLGTLYRRTGHGELLQYLHYGLALLLAIAALLFFFGAELFGQNGQLLGLYIHLAGGPVVTFSVIRLTLKHWPKQDNLT